MLQCFDNECGCGPGEVQIGASICANPAYYHYLATSTAGNCLPKNFLIRFSMPPDSVVSTNPNQPISASIGYVHETALNVAYGNYKKYDVNPTGLTGDKFELIPDIRCNPSGVGGSCTFIIRGECTDPDTISGIIEMLGCNPDNIPERENKYRVIFKKVK